MLTPQIAAARVAQGAAFLDRVRPGWADLINVDTLQMVQCYRCVLGQIYGDYCAGVAAFGWHPYGEIILALPQVALGFVLADEDLHEGEYRWALDAVGDVGWRTLTEAWIAAIAERRCAVADGEAHDLVTV
jgi:hypothetical protein